MKDPRPMPGTPDFRRPSLFGNRGGVDPRNISGIDGIQTSFQQQATLWLSNITWPKAPFDFNHAKDLAKLAEHIASLKENEGGVVGGPLNEADQKILWAVAMFHELGRVGNGEENADSRHVGAVSARIADTILRDGSAQGTIWEKSEVRDEVCRLVYRHADANEAREDKRLQVFQDAERLEGVRFGVKTAMGLAYIKEQCKPDLFFTGFGKEITNLRKYMKFKGW